MTSRGVISSRANVSGRVAVPAMQNLMQVSEGFTGASTGWFSGATTQAANTNETLDPWGTNKATKIIETTATSAHNMSGGLQAATTKNFTISAYFKAGTRNFSFIIADYGTFQINCMWNLTTGANTKAQNSDTTKATLINVNSINVGNGWWRCSVSFKLFENIVSAVYPIGVGMSADGTTVGYTGDTSKYLYCVGVQYVNSIHPLNDDTYVPTTGTAVNTGVMRNHQVLTQNLLMDSTNIAGGNWNSIFATRTADTSITDPFGTTTATRINETTDTSQHYIYHLAGIQTTQPQSWLCHSVYLKAGTQTFGGIYVDIGSVQVITTMNLTTGAITNTAGFGLGVDGFARASNAGNGWWRLETGCFIPSFTTAFYPNGVKITNSGGIDHSYAGDIAKYIYCCAPQMSRTNYAPPYIATAGTLYDIGIPRNSSAQ